MWVVCGKKLNIKKVWFHLKMVQILGGRFRIFLCHLDYPVIPSFMFASSFAICVAVWTLCKKLREPMRKIKHVNCLRKIVRPVTGRRVLGSTYPSFPPPPAQDGLRPQEIWLPQDIPSPPSLVGQVQPLPTSLDLRLYSGRTGVQADWRQPYFGHQECHFHWRVCKGLVMIINTDSTNKYKRQNRAIC